MADEPEVISTENARAGSTPHIARYVLMISVALTAIGFVVAYASSPDSTVEGSAKSYQSSEGSQPAQPAEPGLNPGGGPAQGDATTR